MSRWSRDLEDDLAALLKDWLKQQGRTQADLRRSLRAISTRMPAILEVLQREHRNHGLAGLASRLCAVEAEWHGGVSTSPDAEDASDPFGQLDMLLQEIREDCPD